MITIDHPLASGRRAVICFTERSDGDFAIGAHGVAERRREICPHPWSWLEQVHGSHVLAVREPGQHAGARADGLVTARAGAVLAVQTADCVPLALAGAHAVAVVHAGWRGVEAGIVEHGLERLAEVDDGPVHGFIGPCIRAPHYEFGADDIDRLSARYGADVRAETLRGTPALDLPAAVRAAVGERVMSLSDRGDDTAHPDWYSHRVRGDAARHTCAVWIEP